MSSHRSLLLALVLFVFCCVVVVLLAAVAAMGMTLSPPGAVGALGLSAGLVAGVIVLHRAVREARWDAGYRLR